MIVVLSQGILYLQDHLGNNRVVAKSDGTVIQTNHYYPFGMSFTENTHGDKQPYKYNNKELDMNNGLNWYDYDARQMEAVSGRFTSIDPMAENYCVISPYIYCNNNPVKYIDQTGMFFTGYTVNQNGYISKVNDEGGQDFYVFQTGGSSNQSRSYSPNSWT